MTESDWHGCCNLSLMLDSLRGRVSDATIRFFLVGCCRRVEDLLSDRRSLDAVALGEAFARGIITSSQLSTARVAAEEAVQDAAVADQDAESRICNAVDAERWRELGARALAARAAAGVVVPLAAVGAVESASAAADAAATVADDDWDVSRRIEENAQCELLRELVDWQIESVVW